MSIRITSDLIIALDNAIEKINATDGLIDFSEKDQLFLEALRAINDVFIELKNKEEAEISLHMDAKGNTCQD